MSKELAHEEERREKRRGCAWSESEREGKEGHVTEEGDSTTGAHTNKRHGQQARSESKRTRGEKQTRTGETRRGSGRPERVEGTRKGESPRRRKVENKEATQ